MSGRQHGRNSPAAYPSFQCLLRALIILASHLLLRLNLSFGLLHDHHIAPSRARRCTKRARETNMITGLAIACGVLACACLALALIFAKSNSACRRLRGELG